jgi:hypothetical protein
MGRSHAGYDSSPHPVGTQSVLRDGENGIAPPDSSYQTSARAPEMLRGCAVQTTSCRRCTPEWGKSGGWCGARGKSWNCLVEPAWTAQRDLSGEKPSFKAHGARPLAQTRDLGAPSRADDYLHRPSGRTGWRTRQAGLFADGPRGSTHSPSIPLDLP